MLGLTLTILTGGNRMLGTKEKGILGREKMNKYWDDEEWGIVKERAKEYRVEEKWATCKSETEKF